MGANAKSIEIGPGTYEIGEAKDAFYEQKKLGVLNMIRRSKNKNVMKNLNVFVPEGIIKSYRFNQSNSDVMFKQQDIAHFKETNTGSSVNNQNGKLIFQELNPESLKQRRFESIPKCENYPRDDSVEKLQTIIERSSSPIKYVFIVEDKNQIDRTNKMTSIQSTNFQNFKSNVNKNLKKIRTNNESYQTGNLDVVESSHLDSISYNQQK